MIGTTRGMGIKINNLSQITRSYFGLRLASGTGGSLRRFAGGSQTSASIGPGRVSTICCGRAARSRETAGSRHPAFWGQERTSGFEEPRVATTTFTGWTAGNLNCPRALRPLEWNPRLSHCARPLRTSESRSSNFLRHLRFPGHGADSGRDRFARNNLA